ncbi:extracellular solute-binding protein [Micromonospora polyrhachis]|uniref:Cellobiose transport system substrate-binding protein n=1 Tax=Micromonospora polyrhachis TaxID=1282883 RepID=A0A7W7SP85_9ACTN|nr:ABC transporter substrate-binding protein [Micromonospora polyrhachis]MBB4957210.1 cellobiose transport system substrate-binding protein [Micromonospora polyrhachis]
MSVTRRGVRGIAVVALATSMALGTAACSKDSGGGDSADGKVTVVLQYFGSPGFDQAVADFQAKNPGIKVDAQNMGQLKDFQPKLVQWLATGKGAGDVVMLEEGPLQGYLQDHKNFANLLDLGAAELESSFLPYKWANGFTADKKKLVGLGTDIGGLAMCYRSDLFAKAGLPTNRDEVSKLWPTWEAYAAKGAEFKAKNTGAAWIDSATSIMQPYIMQNSDTWFYDTSNKFIGDTNPVVRKAWEYGLKLGTDGLTSKLTRWQPDWDASFKKSAFATLPCPAWMTGVIAERAGDEAKGKWDVAAIPGGSGNWGGSYLAIPEQSTKKKQAFELLKYLTGKEGSLANFKEKGNMPSNVPALDDPQFKDSTNVYFSNAPTGTIFGTSVKQLKPIYLGPKHQQLWENIFEPQMQAAEQGRSPADAAWQKAVEEGRKLAEG